MMENFDINEIMRLLPHRYPFLLVDRILEFESGKSLVALKNVSFNENYFQGHFPQKPVMPGVLILEALAQATGILALKSDEKLEDDESLYYLVGIDKARFKQPVVPGDQLILKIELTNNVRGIGKFNAEASVDGKYVASAEIMCAKRNI